MAEEMFSSEEIRTIMYEVNAPGMLKVKDRYGMPVLIPAQSVTEIFPNWEGKIHYKTAGGSYYTGPYRHTYEIRNELERVATLIA